LGSTPKALENFYSVSIFAKHNYVGTCGEQCPVDLYVSITGEGELPVVGSYYVASGFDWRIEKWESLPKIPIVESRQPLVVSMSRITATGSNSNRERILLSIDKSGVRVLQNGT
jgi:hypothetical protein